MRDHCQDLQYTNQTIDKINFLINQLNETIKNAAVHNVSIELDVINDKSFYDRNVNFLSASFRFLKY